MTETLHPAGLPDELARLTAAMITRIPTDCARIAAGAALVAAVAVEPPRTGTVWLVCSERLPSVVYHTTTHTCSCADARLRERRCKHSYAVVLWCALEDEARWQALVQGSAADRAYSTVHHGDVPF